MLIDMHNNTAWQSLGSSCTVDRHIYSQRAPSAGNAGTSASM